MMRNKPFTMTTKTKESFGQNTNINSIAARAFKGQPVPMQQGVALYGDFTSANDLQTALEKVDEARAIFQALPAAVRGRFRHDPVEYVSFMEALQAETEGTREIALDLGLVEPTDQERNQATEARLARAREVVAQAEELASPPKENPLP